MSVYVPAGQASHLEAAASAPNFPDGHATHDVLLLLPSASLYVPGGHASGAAMPSSSQMCPIGHVSHARAQDGPF